MYTLCKVAQVLARGGRPTGEEISTNSSMENWSVCIYLLCQTVNRIFPLRSKAAVHSLLHSGHANYNSHTVIIFSAGVCVH